MQGKSHNTWSQNRYSPYRKYATVSQYLRKYSDVPQVKHLQRLSVLDNWWSQSNQPSRSKSVVPDEKGDFSHRQQSSTLGALTDLENIQKKERKLQDTGAETMTRVSGQTVLQNKSRNPVKIDILPGQAPSKEQNSISAHSTLRQVWSRIEHDKAPLPEQQPHPPVNCCPCAICQTSVQCGKYKTDG